MLVANKYETPDIEIYDGDGGHLLYKNMIEITGIPEIMSLVPLPENFRRYKNVREIVKKSKLLNVVFSKTGRGVASFGLFFLTPSSYFIHRNGDDYIFAYNNFAGRLCPVFNGKYKILAELYDDYVIPHKKVRLLKKLKSLLKNVDDESARSRVLAVMRQVKNNDRFTPGMVDAMNNIAKNNICWVVDKCIICGKKARTFTGHLHYEHIKGSCYLEKGKTITAGFCSEECMRIAITIPNNTESSCIGCVGIYLSKYGKKIERL